jgi:chromosome transmission fidelity protein 4
MGALSDEGAVFASVMMPNKSGGAEPSTIFFRPLAHYSTKAQWLYTLQDGEDAVSVATGGRWAAVATSRNWLRLFSFT